MTNITQSKSATKQPSKPLSKLQLLCQSFRHQLSQIESTLTALDELSQTTSRSTRSAHSKNSTNVGTVDVATEAPISFREASEMISTHPSTSTISRWCDVGCRGIKLESAYYGGRRKTSREAVLRFLVACRELGFAGMADAYGLEKAMAAEEQLAEEQRDNRDADSLQGGDPSGRGAKRRNRRPKSSTE